MTSLLPAPPLLFAHRGFSSRQPEMTLAAYQEAVDWSLSEGVHVGLECDVQLSADDQLVCLHDETLDRTSDASGPVRGRTLAELRAVDFGSWKVADPAPGQRSMVTLAELLALVHDARSRGADVTLVIETKHFRDRSLRLERRVCELLTAHGWHRQGSPVRLITFSVPGARLLARLLPEVDRSLLVERRLGCYTDGRLPEGIRVVGVDVKMLRRDPGFVARARRHGHVVHAWTVNERHDVEFCRDLGVTGFTTDCPDLVLEVLACSSAPVPDDELVRRLPAPAERSRESSAAGAAAAG